MMALVFLPSNEADLTAQHSKKNTVSVFASVPSVLFWGVFCKGV